MIWIEERGTERYWFEPGATAFPVFQPLYLKLGVYICYHRNFPEGWRALGMAWAVKETWRLDEHRRLEPCGKLDC